MTVDLLIPTLVLMCVAWGVPRLLARIFAEGVRPLLILAAVAALILWGVSALGFVLLYALSGTATPPWPAAIAVFGRLGLLAGLVWAPILILSVAGLPRRWKTAVW